jgi:hypothetical protein
MVFKKKLGFYECVKQIKIKCVEADFFWLDIEGFETGLDQHLFAVKMEQPFF